MNEMLFYLEEQVLIKKMTLFKIFMALSVAGFIIYKNIPARKIAEMIKYVRSHWILFAGALVIILIIMVFGLFTRLRIEVRTDGVYYRYFPYIMKYVAIPYTEIEYFQEKIYNPLMEYGGWGVKEGSHGKAVTFSGNQGVIFVMKNKSQMLLGSRNPEELIQKIKFAQDFANKQAGEDSEIM